jgi:hypothetical protein
VHEFTCGDPSLPLVAETKRITLTSPTSLQSTESADGPVTHTPVGDPDDSESRGAAAGSGPEPAGRKPDGSGPAASDRGGGTSEARHWQRFAGLGMELSGATLGLAAVGYGLDRWRGADGTIGVALGALIGFAFGMFRLIQTAMDEIRKQDQ